MIVIGASAGGVEALQALVAQFPPDLPASVLVAIHLNPGVRSEMPAILSRAGRLCAMHPTSGQRIEHGRIYVAPPDHHMMVEDSIVNVWRGPKENRHRPAINPLFRSAATTYRSRVAGVLLTGLLDDGTAGLWQIKRNGGVAIVQDPATARFPDMIESALEYVSVDHIASLSEMGALLVSLATGEEEPMGVSKWKRKHQ
jgi:two-component system, chemotaxis family, protein-glutamate methylesterase/glutaminase